MKRETNLQPCKDGKVISLQTIQKYQLKSIVENKPIFQNIHLAHELIKNRVSTLSVSLKILNGLFLSYLFDTFRKKVAHIYIRRIQFQLI